ncbi:ATP-binding protein [Croceivirga sp. JEA036]|uniref:ATP-binding protein n=1 Tax=Croceivirga sp. JEA036 TaxID=2721162 RepID=UPI001438F300|nr:ATP-binding protein [Croceivirga sp. JEA036]NJB38025.1 histidine kinase [Croceivirga sp. JEA036]
MQNRINLFFLIQVLLICILQNSLLAQGQINFTAFGHQPKTVPDSLFVALSASTDVDKTAQLFTQIAKLHLQHGNSDSVLYYAKKLDTLSLGSLKKTSKNNTFKQQSLLLLGNGNLQKGFFDDAMAAFFHGLNLTNKQKNYDLRHELELGLGKSYFKKDSIGKAVAMFTQLCDTSESPQILAEANYYLGNIQLQQDNRQKAKNYYVKAQELINDQNSKVYLAATLTLGNIHALNQEVNLAYLNFEQVMQKSIAQRYYDLYTQAILRYGQLSREQENYEVAEMVLSMGYANSLQWNNLEMQKDIIQGLIATYKAKGDFENAYALMTQFVRLNKELAQQQNKETIKELQVQYETVQKENEILALKETQLQKENELDRQRTIKKAVLYGFLAVLVPIIGLLVVYYQKLQTQSKLNEQQEELSQQRMKTLMNKQELALAKAGLNAQHHERSRIAKQLHDSIGGNLAGIKLQLSSPNMDKEVQKEVALQVNETYELVREISHDLTPKKFIQDDFSALLKDYLKRIDQNATVEISFSAHPKERINLISEKIKVELYQITQELVTNTLKHAKAKHIDLHINILDDVLQLLFEDDGFGFNLQNTSQGIGLKNIKQRLHYLQGTMVIDSALNRGTAITIEIPV